MHPPVHQDIPAVSSTLFGSAHLCIFPAQGRVVRAAQRVVESKPFDLVIILVIVASTLHMTHDPPPDAFLAVRHEPPLWHAIGDWVFIGVFSGEMVLKLVAYGIIGYWGDPWNRLDAVCALSGT